MTQSIRFTLFSRSYCHLCDDMLAALKRELDSLAPARSHDIAVVDVDADPALLQKYDELVPVLAGEGADGGRIEICHYFLDPVRLADFLRGADVSSTA